MARPGPRPMPTNLRLLHGDNQHRINRQEPIPRALLPECPAEVSDEVRAVWTYTLNELAAMRTVTAADRDALVCFCEAVVTHRKVSALLARSSVLIQSARSERQLVRNPLLQIQRDAAATVRMFAEGFGLMPSARSTVRVPGPPGPGDDLLTGG